MKKKVLSIAFVLSIVLTGSIALASKTEIKNPAELDGVASWGKQYWKDGLTKLCCDQSDFSKPCSASTTDC